MSTINGVFLSEQSCPYALQAESSKDSFRIKATGEPQPIVGAETGRSSRKIQGLRIWEALRKLLPSERNKVQELLESIGKIMRL